MRIPARRRCSAEVDPIGAYVSELEAELGARRMLRRRVLREVRSHLRESADELAQGNATTLALAEREAVARFGGAEELARGLRSAVAHRSLLANRLVTLSVAWAAAMAMGSATVWAAVNLQSTSSVSARHGSSHVAHAGKTRPAHGTASIELGGAAALRRCETASAAHSSGCKHGRGASKER